MSTWGTSSSTSYRSHGKSSDFYFQELKLRSRPERPDKVQGKPELKDEVLKIIANGYFDNPQFVWFMDREKRIYDEETISLLKNYHGLAPFIYDPVNGDWKYNIPNQNHWHEGLITDCLEHHDGHIVRANIIKFALTCLTPDSSARKLTIIVKKGMGLEAEDIIDLANIANAKGSWKPDQFEKIEDRICIAVK